MNNEELQKKILNTIEDKCIEPKSSTYFKIKTVILWMVLVVLVAVTAVSLSLLLFHIMNGGYFKGNLMLFGRVAVNTVLIALVVHYLKSMKCAYRKSLLYWIILGAVTVSIGGVLVFATKAHHQVDKHLGKMNRNLSVEMQAQDHWSQPDEFRLSGVVVRKVDTQRYQMRDFNDVTWTVDISESIAPTQQVFDRIEQVRIIGFKNGDVFMSCAGAPWMPKGMMKPSTIKKRMDFIEEMRLSDDPASIVIPERLEQWRERNIELLRSNKCQ